MHFCGPKIAIAAKVLGFGVVIAAIIIFYVEILSFCIITVHFFSLM
jgi:hypothetical protein